MFLKHFVIPVAELAMVGTGLMVKVNVLPAPVQPVFLTATDPVYVPAATFAAIGIVNGLEVMAILLILTKPAASAGASQVTEYRVGVPVRAL